MGYHLAEPVAHVAVVGADSSGDASGSLQG